MNFDRTTEGQALSYPLAWAPDSRICCWSATTHVTSPAIGRGENAGHTLTESNVVRSIAAIGQWSGTALMLRADAVAGEHQVVLLEDNDGATVSAARVVIQVKRLLEE
ncbi:hypothetical protein PPGU19_099100 (plasmid) [Paraburkholderia sp. PGU19]|uniref:hypothetical protein n=1 Tax=Paraburkholderia sp. PGU19 TaxID=2735434 RepID=UPI0015DB2CAE|nr:hypothetical protein [Paraburkholderia sp. PGU19]BCG05342.1 hypothetical protein PPGU19_099100 [Paraburkholderia sp. PGU19]